MSVDLGLLFDELETETIDKISIDSLVTCVDEFCELDFVANELEHVLECPKISACSIQK